MCLAVVNETRRSFNDKFPKTFLCKSLERNNCYLNIVYTQAHSSGRFCSENITYKYLSLKQTWSRVTDVCIAYQSTVQFVAKLLLQRDYKTRSCARILIK